jgi:tetratricopeptide (TPR) repeat protein
MSYSKRLIYLSNQWYNDGLKKANIRDLSGAIVSLKKSLQYNRDNIAARNLLALVYYGRGEVSEALVEWIISKNIRSHNNIANYYIKKVQESVSELETIDQAVKKYNQCLVYCQQNGEDLAAIQLKKVLAAHPTFLKAYQLLTLLYMQTEQYAKARQMIRKAHRLDTTNEITLLYMHELKQLHADKAAKLKSEKSQAVSYNLGNETIIQPVSSTLKDNATLMTILNIAIGLVVGGAVVGLLAIPTMRRNMVDRTNKEIIAYSEQIAALESELDLQTKELEQYKATSEETEVQKEVAQGTQANYEALVKAVEHYNNKNYKRSELANELLAINPSALGEVGQTTYNAMTAVVYPQQCGEMYPNAVKSYQVKNYTRATELLEKVVAMDEKYQSGEALYMLIDMYVSRDEADKANAMFNRVVALFPDTDVARRASEKIATIKTTE